MSDSPSKLCRYCGTEVKPGTPKCPMCWEPIGWRWWTRILRRGITWGLLISALTVGGVWMRGFMNKGVEAYHEMDEVKAALEGALGACKDRPCAPEVQQAKALVDQASEQTRNGKHEAALANLKAARALLLAKRPDVATPPAPAQGDASGAAAAGLVAIAPGEFMMGSFGNSADEQPAHAVSLGGYAIMPREVTVEEYQRYGQEVRQSCPEQPAGSGPKHPVVFITWHEAKAYCEHYGLRLPTEAEWERAARCGSVRDFPGDGTPAGLDRVAWHRGDSQGTAHPAGAKAASACFLYDMSGNAAEWVSDWYAPDYYLEGVAQNPTGPAQGDDRVVRGGAFDSPAESLRLSFRDRFSPDSGRGNIGFRCAR
ncbi:MAG: SUMF1/EgtB/PvdO family nonheme iron enzyme [Elusimicrobia bacterium]|nr:SUMF1/EgtB/PvdO family nonheme iron enzyme [Elusimicrobiota bacterium]